MGLISHSHKPGCNDTLTLLLKMLAFWAYLDIEAAR